MKGGDKFSDWGTSLSKSTPGDFIGSIYTNLIRQH